MAARGDEPEQDDADDGFATRTATGDPTDPASAPTLAAVGPAGARPAAVEPASGDVIDHFALAERLGAGGMGIVYAARDTLLDRRVAIKLLRPDTARSPEAWARLLREAQALAKLSHPNVVTVYEVGLTGDDVFIAMELIEGTTLREWGKEPHPWRAVVAAFLAAGRGLAAAHALGLVHRDFKPGNVLVDRAGLIKVTDFGLVAVAGQAIEPGDGEALSSSPLSAPITRTGATMGTPGYMAPEQQGGGRIDPRADQYSFCVSLDEALSGRGAPAAIRAALTRGRSVDAAARFPSMNALLAVLERHTRRSRWPLLAAGGLAVAGALGLYLARPAEDACAGAGRRLAEVWSEAPRARVRAAFTAADPVQGSARFAAVDTALTAYGTAGVTMSVAACRATRAGEQSDSLLDLRMRCLERRRAEVAANVEVFAAARGPEQLDRAADAVYRLAPLAGCADAEALAAALPPPDDPAQRAQVDELEGSLDEVEALHRAGDDVAALPRAIQLAARARAVDFAPVLARALLLLAAVHEARGDRVAAEVAYREGVLIAAAARDDRTAALAWLGLIDAVAGLALRPNDALAMLPAAEAAVARAGNPVDLRADLRFRHSHALRVLLRYDEALLRVEEARRLLEEALGGADDDPLLPMLADVLLETGVNLLSLGRSAEARARYERAIALWDRLYGPEHLTLAPIYENLSELLRTEGKPAEAVIECDRAVRLRERQGATHPGLAHALVSRAAALADAGRHDEARIDLERALAIQRALLPAGHPDLAAALMTLANALGHLSRGDEARALYDEAIAILERADAKQGNLPIALFNRAEVALREARYPEAIADYTRALALFEARLGAEHPHVVYPLIGLGRAHVHAGAPALAIAPLERILRTATPGRETALVSTARFYLGRALVESRRDRARGMALAAQARAELAAAGGGAQLTEIDDWLRAIRARRGETP